MTAYEWVSWIIVVLGAFGGRAVGSWLSRRTGARHAVAWFGTLAGFTATVVLGEALMYAASQPGWGIQDWKNNLKDWQLAGCMIYGAIVASVVEVIAIVIELAVTARSTDSPDSPRRRPFRLRSALVVAVLACLLYADYRVSLAPALRWRRAHDQIRTMVDSLAQHRPQGVTKGQWVWVVGWTHNGVDNCFFSPSHIKDEERYYHFADELKRRIQSRVDLSTIDWIWDEFETISTGGRSYSDNWRPTTPEHFREAGPTDFGFDVP
jgi:hypothetical protein